MIVFMTMTTYTFILRLSCVFATVVRPVVLLQGIPWGYRGETGPDFWSELEGGENCNGLFQSPIDIVRRDTQAKSFSRWNFDGYDNDDAGDQNGAQIKSIINNGHTVQVNLEGDYFISGGGLSDTYKAVQFHFHWGEDNTLGSEHTKEGQTYAAEMHIVHYNVDRFDGVKHAMTRPEGLAVLGVWIEVGKYNKAFEPIIEALQQIKYKGQQWTFDKTLALSDLLPDNIKRFYRYSGSLTTPGCFETVVWTMFDQPIQLSKKQLSRFRKLRQTSYSACQKIGKAQCPEEVLLDLNYRPVQNLNGRTVYRNKVKSTEL